MGEALAALHKRQHRIHSAQVLAVWLGLVVLLIGGLLLINLFNYIDRQVLAAVVPQVKETFFGKGGTGELFVDGQSVAKKTMDHMTPIMFPEDEDFDIGSDTRTGVAAIEYRYDVPFKFTGTIDKLTFKLGPTQLTAEDRKQLPAIADRVARAKD
mgnify:CR=1 FL=1